MKYDSVVTFRAELAMLKPTAPLNDDINDYCKQRGLVESVTVIERWK